MTLSTILFDLDGTLVDTAPDLAYALNALLKHKVAAQDGVYYVLVCRHTRLHRA
jgi:phosphoglycolate phosphatase-like HAD superfamily hydrolase